MVSIFLLYLSVRRATGLLVFLYYFSAALIKQSHYFSLNFKLLTYRKIYICCTPSLPLGVRKDDRTLFNNLENTDEEYPKMDKLPIWVHL